MKSRTKSTR
jgi:hypothetical protein